MESVRSSALQSLESAAKEGLGEAELALAVLLAAASPGSRPTLTFEGDRALEPTPILRARAKEGLGEAECALCYTSGSEPIRLLTDARASAWVIAPRPASCGGAGPRGDSERREDVEEERAEELLVACVCVCALPTRVMLLCFRGFPRAKFRDGTPTVKGSFLKFAAQQSDRL